MEFPSNHMQEVEYLNPSALISNLWNATLLSVVQLSSFLRLLESGFCQLLCDIHQNSCSINAIIQILIIMMKTARVEGTYYY